MCLFDSLNNPGGLAVTTNAWGTNGWIYSGTYGITANTNSWHQLGVGSAAIVQLKDGTLVIAYSGINSNDYAFNAFSNSIGIATAKLNYWPAIQPGVITNTDLPLQYAKLGKLSVGTNTSALGSYSLVVGRNNANAGENSLAVGQVVIGATASNSMAVGGSQGNVSIAAGLNDAIAMGSGAYVTGDHGKAIGTVVRARALDSLAIGTGIDVEGSRSVGIGAHAVADAITNTVNESIMLHVNPSGGRIIFDGAAPYMNGANITNLWGITTNFFLTNGSVTLQLNFTNGLLCYLGAPILPPWSPTNNSDGVSPVLWVVANDLGASSNAVQVWNDRSGNNNHMKQDTGSKRPEIRTNALNGLNTVYFNGTSEYITNTTATTNGAGVTFDQTFVVRFGYNGLDYMSCDAGAPLAHIPFNSGAARSWSQFNLYCGTAQLTGAWPLTNVWVVYHVTWQTGTNSLIYTNNVSATAQATTAGSSHTMNGLSIGGSYTGLGNFSLLECAEAIMWTNNLSASARSNAWWYLKTKYGL